MTSSPWLTLAAAVLGFYLFWLWLRDYRACTAGDPAEAPLPGATPVSGGWIVTGAIGAALLLALETAGEVALGVSDQQSTVTVLALVGFISAGFYEELIFRGFIFYDRRGARWLAASIVTASLLFALLHYHYYVEVPEDGRWRMRLDAKSGWTLLLLFLNSLWFYFLRFSSRNPGRSLIPCFVAHICSNVGVFVVKAAQGFVSGWW